MVSEHLDGVVAEREIADDLALAVERSSERVLLGTDWIEVARIGKAEVRGELDGLALEVDGVDGLAGVRVAVIVNRQTVDEVAQALEVADRADGEFGGVGIVGVPLHRGLQAGRISGGHGAQRASDHRGEHGRHQALGFAFEGARGGRAGARHYGG